MQSRPFPFYAISTLAGRKPSWSSIRNACEPRIVTDIPAGMSKGAIAKKLGGIAGRIYGIYQYRTTLNSAFTGRGVAAGP